MEDVLSVAFLIPKKKPSDTQLVGFHLSHPMRYVDSAPYFFMATETVDDLANKVISQREQADKHPLDLVGKARPANDNASAPAAQADASWEHLPVE